MPGWSRIVTDRGGLRRALLTGLDLNTVSRIQVTAEARDRLAGQSEFERRRIVDVKGQGPFETWVLVGRRRVSRSGRARAAGAKSRASAW